MCKKLGLVTELTSVKIYGINDTVSTINRKATVDIESGNSTYSAVVECLVKSSIAGIVTCKSVNLDIKSIPNNIQLADPFFSQPERVDILLGAELFLEILKPEKIDLIEGAKLQNSEFGFIVMGRVSNASSIVCELNQISSFHVSLHELNDKIQQFWDLENIGTPNNYSIEEKLCEADYVKNTKRDSTGRYIVALPVKQNLSNLGMSSKYALEQFYRLEKKLTHNDKIRIPYTEFMKEYLDLNQMEEVSDPNDFDSSPDSQYYLPHHSVIRESSSTTKLRVVFNASFKTSTGLSLNDCLLTGPTIQQDLYSILLRFRKYQIGVTGDIAKMYRQILVEPGQRDLQRIWWRENDKIDPKTYRLKTVTYGTACAPFLAIRTLFQLASDEEKDYPLESEMLKHDFYVDDLLTGADTVDEATLRISRLCDLLLRGGFELRKITSNHPNVHMNNTIEQNKSILILGIEWETKPDIFCFSFQNFTASNQMTKRSVLSEIAQLFDPLGFCGPIIFQAKFFMQKLWLRKLLWDDELPSDLHDLWSEFKQQLLSMGKVQIPRCVALHNPKKIELHGFSDASEKGLGCCIYIRTEDQNGKCLVRFLCSKNRIAPLKSQTIPRLELCAALLLAELVHKTLSAMNEKFSALYLWTDSEITLYRIRSYPSRFCPFVANRISRIQDLTSIEDWHYVPTEENPADHNSRGLMPDEFLKCKQWFGGPTFLQLPTECWPPQPSNTQISSELMEYRKQVVLVSEKVVEWDVISDCSDYLKLLRRIALILRFIDNMKASVSHTKSNMKQPIEKPAISSRKRVDLSAVELDRALKVIVKHIQANEYAIEISLLQRNKTLPKQSKLLSLSPFLDSDNILRVGGRIIHANVPENYKHQMLLPSTHSFSKLLARSEHFRLLHAGPQALLYAIRENFWIIGGRNLCKSTVKFCVRCTRTRPKTYSQIMGNLPKERVSSNFAFENVGIDFCGPFQIKGKVRSRVLEKAYIAIFICFATKAVHLEVVSDLKSETFMAAFKRFISTRGCCTNVFSDNATNFVGAKSELQELQQLFASELHKNEITRYCNRMKITWRTIPPRSPHFGGLWEAAVKSAKFHLRRVVGHESYTHEQLETLAKQIEACMNSRPLGPMSDDPNDMTCLTPGHFLIGRPIMSLPDPSLSHLNFNRLSSFQKIQWMFQNFWSRWSKEILSEYQHRRKWVNAEVEPQINEVVIVKDDNLPPFYWPLGRIQELHRGKDGRVRVVSIKCSDKIYKRAITQICPLPVDTESCQSLIISVRVPNK